MTDSGTEKKRSLSVICSKGSFDMAYPGLILANAARMAGVDARLFFTFWGLDIVNEKKIDHLHLNLVGNPSAPLPAMIAGLPGVEALATAQMRKEMESVYQLLLLNNSDRETLIRLLGRSSSSAKKRLFAVRLNQLR